MWKWKTGERQTNKAMFMGEEAGEDCGGEGEAKDEAEGSVECFVYMKEAAGEWVYRWCMEVEDGAGDGEG